MANPEALMLWEEMRKDVKNKLCVECGANNPQWASVSYGTIFCLECSGVHRSLGVHISFVRSLTMDQWSQEQLRKMKVGGNRKFAEFFEAHGVPPHYSIKEKYHTEVAQIYKDKISALSSGKEWRDPPVGSLSTVPVLPQARVIASPSGPAAGSQEGQSSASSSRYGGMGNFTPKPSNSSSSDSEWSALLGSSWGAISAITSTAAAKTQELAQIAAEKIQTGTTDISSKVQTTDWSSVKQNLVSSSQSTWSSFSSFLSSATESLTHLAKEVTLSEEEVRKQQQAQGQGISASVVPSDTFGDWEIPDDLSPPPPSSLKSSSSSKASVASSSPASSPSLSSSQGSKTETKAKGAWNKEAYAQGWSSAETDKGTKEKPLKTVTKTSSSGSGSKDGWDNWDAGWEDEEEDEDDSGKKKTTSEKESSSKATASSSDASGWSDPSWDSNWDNAD